MHSARGGRLVLAVTLTGGIGLCQQAVAGDVTQLEAIGVTAAGQATSQRDLAGTLGDRGASVDIITAEDIRETGATTLTQALEVLAPGVYVQPQAGGRAGAGSISLLGGDEREFVMLLDGVRIEPRTFFGTHLNINPQHIERIEVLKDGQSLFYGSNAMVGVINFVTKDFDYAEQGEFMGEAGRSLGERSQEELNLGGHANLDVGDHRFQVFGSQNRGINEPFDSDRLEFPEGAPNAYEGSLQNLGFKYRYDLSDSERIDLHVQRNELREDGLPTGFGDPSEQLVNDRRTQQDIAMLQWERQVDSARSMSLRAFWNEQEGDRREVDLDNGDAVYTRGGNLSRDYGLHGMTDFPALAGHWTVGAEASRHEGYNLGDATLSNPGYDPETSLDPFVQYRPDIAFLPRTDVSVGARYNHNDRTDSAAIWQLMVRHRMTSNVDVRATAGTAFQVPRAVDTVDAERDVVGASDLDPESSIGGNIGLEGRAVPGLDVPASWSVSAFWREITDRIDDEEEGDDVLRVFNVDDPTITRGVEGQFAVRPLPQWSVRFNATYVEAYMDNDPDQEQLDDIPRFFARAQLGWDAAQAQRGARLSGVYTGPVYDTLSDEAGGRQNYGGRMRVDASAFQFFDERHDQRLGVRVENVFDTDVPVAIDETEIGGELRRYDQYAAPRNVTLTYSQNF
ncbi:Outer membrane receptor for ferrienterochelin and colicins [Aquisalimonas asiatica]|uniref:Outer membrane receptor for ferrienterochelin and colicins n=2 Tax=Aquisalimonas asiatica TaxID=406100 RepID=A0A1H8TD76_9GAMM|nr:Outer membrane receptor for ferrienterochelin and colicins [Aquisalimonas asiatica]